MKRLILLALLLIVVGILSSTVLAIQTDQVVFYVDNVNGNDDNSGTSLSTAFQTIERARDAVRTINDDMHADIIVYIRGGEYLGTQYRIVKIEIPDRPHYDNGETRRNFEIWASNNSDMNQGHVVLGTLGSGGYLSDGIWILNVTDNTPYRYIALMKTQSEYMYIEEFRVYGVWGR